ncbi:winged helix family transcriptional regulator [Clostridium sp. AF19-22AC]|jgi:two-component system response regulator QseB|uniref:winged helix-turn-helix domain-containing protein n=1 Tax=Clostridia TaxID=186801 RepID=UPI000E479165|nr:MULTISPECIES: winged helix-turn-helix domain-containing protein [Clostridia]RHR25851.1 winged helix family transcriptional regulator [Clostridium sp. AF19-22AC]
MQNHPPEFKPEIILGGGILHINRMEYTVTYKGREIMLSTKELLTLYCLAEHPGWVLRKEDIYLKVWGDSRGDTPFRTVENTICKLRKKLDPQIIVTIRYEGYKLNLKK